MASSRSSSPRHGQEAGDDNYIELADLAAVKPRSADWRRILTRREAREVYDKHGGKDMVKDSESVYGGPATAALLQGADGLSTAKVLFEFGHGSGRLALRLLQHELPEDCSYIGVDQSSVMHEMAKQRLSMFSDRAELLLSPDGDPSTAIAGSKSAQDETVDVFVSTYVLDLLSEEDVAEVLRLAGRILRPGGQLCLTGLTYGTRVGPLAASATLAWEAVHLLAPKVVGGCRAQRLEDYLGPLWEVKSSTVVSGGFVSSEVLICSKREDITRITSNKP